MMQGRPRGAKILVWAVISSFLLSSRALSLDVLGEDPEAKKATLVGTIYQEDQKTPLAGAVVWIRSFDTQKEHSSEPTDGTGKYRITNIDEGWYAFGVSSPKGDFNLGYGINLKANQTATIVVWIQSGGQLERVESDETKKKKSFFKRPTGILGVVVLTAGGAFTLLSKKESEVSPVR